MRKNPVALARELPVSQCVHFWPEHCVGAMPCSKRNCTLSGRAWGRTRLAPADQVGDGPVSIQKDRDLTEEWELEMKILRTLTAMAAAAAALTIAAQARADVIDFLSKTEECGPAPCYVPTILADSAAVEVLVEPRWDTGATVKFTAPGAPGPATIDTPV